MPLRNIVDPRRYRRPGEQGRLPSWTLTLVPVLMLLSGWLMVSSTTAPWSWAALPIAVLAPALAWIDLDSHRLPDHYTAAMAALTLMGLVLQTVTTGTPRPLVRGLLAAAATVAVLLVAVLAGSGVGMGDIKLLVPLALIGAAVSWRTYGLQLAAGILLNGVLALGMLIFTRASRADPVPLGPGLLLGWLLVYSQQT